MSPVGHIPSDLPMRDEHARTALGQRVAATMSLLGSGTSYLGALTLDMSVLAQTVQLALAVLLTALGVVLWFAKPSKAFMQAAAIVAVLTISTMLGTSDDFGTTPFFYLWPVVFVAYFGTVRLLVATILTMVVTLAVAVVVADVSWSIRFDIFIGTSLCVGMMGGLVALMQSREQRLNEQLAVAAHTDPLTGLLNRRGFDPRFAELISSSERLERSISVVMFDLDHFKRFNDDHGHAVGDEALQRVAAILGGQCREVDLVARLGGEEFAVVLPGAATVDALSYAERVAWALGSERVDASLRLTTSSGIGSYLPGDESVSALVLRADEALYAAKAAGRARAAWWHEDEIQIGETIDVPEVEEHPRPVPVVPRAYVTRRNDLQDEPERASA